MDRDNPSCAMEQLMNLNLILVGYFLFCQLNTRQRTTLNDSNRFSPSCVHFCRLPLLHTSWCVNTTITSRIFALQITRVFQFDKLHVSEYLSVDVHAILRIVLCGCGKVGLLLKCAVDAMLLYHHVFALTE